MVKFHVICSLQLIDNIRHSVVLIFDLGASNGGGLGSPIGSASD